VLDDVLGWSVDDRFAEVVSEGSGATTSVGPTPLPDP